MRVGLKLGQEVIAGVIKQVQRGMYEFPKLCHCMPWKLFLSFSNELGNVENCPMPCAEARIIYGNTEHREPFTYRMGFGRIAAGRFVI